MGQFNQDGVNFNIEANLRPEEDVYAIDGKLVTTNDWSFLKPGKTASKLINAVEIDWNDADFTNAPAAEPTTIITTGQLIGAIKWAASQGPVAGGDAGAQGVMGAQGAVGKQGVIGVQGAFGSQGAMGQQGSLSPISMEPWLMTPSTKLQKGATISPAVTSDEDNLICQVQYSNDNKLVVALPATIATKPTVTVTSDMQIDLLQTSCIIEEGTETLTILASVTIDDVQYIFPCTSFRYGAATLVSDRVDTYPSGIPMYAGTYNLKGHFTNESNIKALDGTILKFQTSVSIRTHNSLTITVQAIIDKIDWENKGIGVYTGNGAIAEVKEKCNIIVTNKSGRTNLVKATSLEAYDRYSYLCTDWYNYSNEVFKVYGFWSDYRTENTLDVHVFAGSPPVDTSWTVEWETESQSDYMSYSGDKWYEYLTEPRFDRDSIDADWRNIKIIGNQTFTEKRTLANEVYAYSYEGIYCPLNAETPDGEYYVIGYVSGYGETVNTKAITVKKESVNDFPYIIYNCEPSKLADKSQPIYAENSNWIINEKNMRNHLNCKIAKSIDEIKQAWSTEIDYPNNEDKARTVIIAPIGCIDINKEIYPSSDRQFPALVLEGGKGMTGGYSYIILTNISAQKLYWEL